MIAADTNVIVRLLTGDEPEQTAQARRLFETMAERVAATTPLKRVVQADEVAQAVMAAVVNLTSTTGWIIPVDGGKLVG